MRALADKYIKQGHQVFGCGRRSETNLNGRTYQSVDLSDYGRVASWVDHILAEVSHIELCVKCAGSPSPGKKLWEFDAQEALSMIDTNEAVLINVLGSVIPVIWGDGFPVQWRSDTFFEQSEMF